MKKHPCVIDSAI